MSNPRTLPHTTPRTAPRTNAVIDPLLRLQQLEQRRNTLPPPSPSARPATPRQTAAPRPADAPRPTRLPAAGGASAEANARLAALQARRPTVGPNGRTTPPARKGKPAQGAKVASLMLSAIATGGLAAMFAGNSAQSDTIVLTGGTAATTATTATTTASATGVTTAATATTAAAAATGQILDGTYVGAADSNRWGTVQVQAVYSGGQLVDVQILSYPDGDSKSVRINQRALPTLINEAVSAQSAQVNTVSGATYTSNSYKASLQSAIDAAKAASGLS